MTESAIRAAFDPLTRLSNHIILNTGRISMQREELAALALTTDTDRLSARVQMIARLQGEVAVLREAQQMLAYLINTDHVPVETACLRTYLAATLDVVHPGRTNEVQAAKFGGQLDGVNKLASIFQITPDLRSPS